MMGMYSRLSFKMVHQVVVPVRRVNVCFVLFIFGHNTAEDVGSFSDCNDDIIVLDSSSESYASINE